MTWKSYGFKKKSDMNGPNPALHRISVCAALFAVVASGSACADVYSFIDADGQIHLSDTRRDARYSLVVKTPTSATRANPSLQANAPPRGLGTCLPGVVARVAQEHQLSEDLLHAVITAESACDPTAVSPKGARGLMQLMPATATRYGVADSFDPVQNLRGGALYLRDLVARYGQRTDLALAAYNAGEDAVLRYGNTVPPFPETQEYVRKVLAFYATLAARPTPGALAPDTARRGRTSVCVGVAGAC